MRERGKERKREIEEVRKKGRGKERRRERGKERKKKAMRSEQCVDIIIRV